MEKYRQKQKQQQQKLTRYRQEVIKMPLKDCQHILIYMTCALCLCLHTVLTQGKSESLISFHSHPNEQ